MVSNDSTITREVSPRPRHLAGAGLVVIGFSSTALWVFGLIWGRSALVEIVNQPGGWLGAILVIVCSAVFHESLHALGWRLIAGVERSSIAVRRTHRVLGLEVTLSAPIEVARYRISLMLPAIVLGLGSTALAMTTGQGLVLLWAVFFLVECLSDISSLFALRGIPSDHLIVDTADGWQSSRFVATDRA